MSTPSFNIATVLGKNYAISQEDASKLYPVLLDAVLTKSPVEISFLGLENCSTIFLRNLLGDLYLTYGDKVDSCVKLTGFGSDDNILLQQIERLRKRALNPSIYQPIFEQAIGQE